MNRRDFVKGGFTACAAAFGYRTWAAMTRHPLAAQRLPKWKRGVFRISTLYTGGSEATFLTFPDGTSALVDCGDIGATSVPRMPDTTRRPGEWTARWVLADNPHGNKVDYFILTHYHSDHAGNGKYSAGRSKRGNYALSGIGQAMEVLDFGTMIDRSWPQMEDPSSTTDGFSAGIVAHLRDVYAEAQKRGTKIERFRLEKGSDQVRLLHGGWKGFAFAPLAARGCVLKRDGSVLDIGETIGVPRSRFTENALSTAMVFSLGGFRYYNGGDFSWCVKTPGGAFAEIENYLAPECPAVDVANANHHGHHSMTDALVKALHARVVITGVWHPEHMNRPTMRRLAKATWPCLYAPGLFPKRRREKDAAESWLKDVAPESFSCAHTVIDVAPDGKAYTLMLVDARDEKRTILGAYDFETSKK